MKPIFIRIQRWATNKAGQKIKFVKVQDSWLIRYWWKPKFFKNHSLIGNNFFKETQIYVQKKWEITTIRLKAIKKDLVETEPNFRLNQKLGGNYDCEETKVEKK